MYEKDSKWRFDLVKINFKDMKKKYILLILSILFLLFFLSKCIFSKNEILFDTYSSYSSVSEVKTILKNNGLSLILANNEEYPSRGESCPQITIKDYKTHTEDNNLTFEFFNEKLYAITIYPSKNKIEEFEKNITKFSYIFCIGFYKATDYRNKVYFRFYDRRFQYKLDKWLSNCS